MNDVRERFMQVYYHLLSEGLVSGYKDFASKIGVSTSMITEISKGRSNVGVSAIQNTVITFSINANWLLTGNGYMTGNYEHQINLVKEEPSLFKKSSEESIYEKLYNKEREENRKLIEEVANLKTELRLKNEEKEILEEEKTLLSFTTESSECYTGNLKDPVKKMQSKKSSERKTL